MPHSASEVVRDPPGYTLAVWAESLYLMNLMVAPFLGFLLLLLVYFRHSDSAPPLARAHLDQTLFASLWGGVALVGGVTLILLLGGLQAPYTWVVVVLYFTLCHTSLILLGMIGLARALAGRCQRFPLVGRPLPDGCEVLDG